MRSVELVEEVVSFGKVEWDVGCMVDFDCLVVMNGIIWFDDCSDMGVNEYLGIVGKWEKSVGSGDWFGGMIFGLFYGEFVGVDLVYLFYIDIYWGVVVG